MIDKAGSTDGATAATLTGLTNGFGQPADTFTLRLAKGRRVEVSWKFDEQNLTRLIRTIEAA